MRNPLQLLTLPSSLLLLITGFEFLAAAESQWPYNLPENIKYFPEDEGLVKRGLSAQEQLATQTPVGVRKMSEDENEMFFLDYWQFGSSGDNGGSPDVHRRDRLLARSLPVEYTNVTMGDSLLPPMLLHSDSPGRSRLQDHLHLFARSNLYPRDFQCPTGTNNCSSISRPYACCATDETCVRVADTGLGDVGCCPNGATCGGQVTNCDTSNGYKSCPGSGNGGCCIPNYDCEGVGCISRGTSTTTTTLPVVTVTTCVSGWFSCAASLGGGCCQNGAKCGSSTSCVVSTTQTSSTPTTTTTSTATASTTTAVAPLRPTGSSDSNDATLPSTLTTGTSLIAVCPTGFYFCSAYYRPGCCRVGRDCATTNCPAAASSSAIVSNGVTILVPAGGSTGGSSYVTTALITGTAAGGGSNKATTTRALTGACPAGGWNSCDASVGGSCCPPNFACGTSCTATGGGATGVVGKVAPSMASGLRVEFFGWVWMVFCAVSGVGMVVL